jgi:hypothetical protein
MGIIGISIVGGSIIGISITIPPAGWEQALIVVGRRAGEEFGLLVYS